MDVLPSTVTEYQSQKSLPKYDTGKLHKSCDRFIPLDPCQLLCKMHGFSWEKVIYGHVFSHNTPETRKNILNLCMSHNRCFYKPVKKKLWSATEQGNVYQMGVITILSISQFWLVGFGWSVQQVKKWPQPFQTHSMLFFVQYQPPYQISFKSHEKRRS